MCLMCMVHEGHAAHLHVTTENTNKLTSLSFICSQCKTKAWTPNKTHQARTSSYGGL